MVPADGVPLTQSQLEASMADCPRLFESGSFTLAEVRGAEKILLDHERKDETQ